MRHRTTSSAEAAVATLASGYRARGDCTTPFYWEPYSSYSIVGSFIPGTEVITFDDIVTPQFEKRRDHGEIIMNPMTKVVTKTEREVVLYDELFSTWKTLTCTGYTTTAYASGLHTYGTVSPLLMMPSETYPATPSISAEAIKDLAITAAWANANETDFESWVFLAEGEKSIKSVSAIVGRFIKLAIQLRKGKLLWALRKELTPKQLADRWMEGRYSIRPLVYDAYALYRALTKPRRKGGRQTYRGSGSGSDSNTLVQKTYTRPGGYEVWARYQTERSISARAGVLALLEDVSPFSQWGFDRTVEALWELTTLSFVADWFFNFGEFIASWTPKLGVRGLASWVTVVDTVTKSKVIDHVVDLYVPTSYTYERAVAISGGLCTTTTQTTNRVPSPNRPLTPTMNIRLNAAKLLDLVIIAKKLWS